MRDEAIDLKHIVVNMGMLVQNLGDKKLGTQIILHVDLLADYFQFKSELKTITWDSIHKIIAEKLEPSK
jgi:hypothetical protein